MGVHRTNWRRKFNLHVVLRRMRHSPLVDTAALAGIAAVAAVLLYLASYLPPIMTGPSGLAMPGWAGSLLGIVLDLAIVVLAMVSGAAVCSRRSRELDLLHSITRAEVDFNAEIDRLTGLLNRTTFLGALKSSVASAAASQKGLTLTLIDIRGFSLLNELIGHDACDAFLVDIAFRLKASIPSAICIGRVGGDQFAVLTYEFDAPGIEDLTRMLEEASPGLEGEGMAAAIRPRFRYGIAHSKKCIAANFSLLQAAEMALGTARQSNSVEASFDSRMRKTLLDRLRTEEDLPRAIDAGEIVPYFQPIITMDDHSLVGFEVLARWLHPSRGIIAPAVFIPMLRNTGLLNLMAGQLIHSACAVARYWPSRLKLTFNFNAEQLAQAWLPNTMLARMAEGGIDPSRVVIEITEDVLGSDDEAVQSTLTAFRQAGCNVALDDFGIGASNISHLRSLEVDYVKIDRSFVIPLPDPRAEQLLRAIVSLAHCLEVQVVAEGIESARAAAIAAELGVAMGQGYAFGRPMDAAAANVFILEVAANHGRVKQVAVTQQVQAVA